MKASPGAFTNASFLLFFKYIFMFYFDCALSLQELYDAIVALRPTFLITLVTVSLGGSTLAHAMLR
jgi:uncharacterized BrkB/YihY/UPF0761 family membrane protein